MTTSRLTAQKLGVEDGIVDEREDKVESNMDPRSGRRLRDGSRGRELRRCISCAHVPILESRDQMMIGDRVEIRGGDWRVVGAKTWQAGRNVNGAVASDEGKRTTLWREGRNTS